MLARILDEADARQLPALIAEWSALADDRYWLARALRIDLALLTERPELVVPCVYRRCAFLGDEGVFFRERPPPPQDFTSLRARVREWAAHAPRPWLRALRPIVATLDGALREEYRGGVGDIWASRDGAWIGTTGDHRRAWDRATGRRIEEANIVDDTAPPPAWTFTAPERSPRILLERGGAHVDLALAGMVALGAVTLSDDLVVVKCSRGEPPYFEEPLLALVDTRAHALRWCVPGDATAFDLRDEALVIVNDTYVAELDLATGAVRRSAHVDGTRVGPLPDGMITSRRNRLAVWDFEAARRPRAYVRSRWNLGVSRDSTRVITGHLLCDARTGVVIAELPLFEQHTQYTAGQLAYGARAFVDGHYVEHAPTGLMRWRLGDGSPLPVIAGRETNGWDRCAWDPRGRYHALWSWRGPLTIWPLADGAPIARLHQAPAKHRDRIAFSPDGTRLSWENADGITVGVMLDDPTTILPMEPGVPERPPRATRDGLLVVGAAAIPVDTDMISTPDGRAFVSNEEHYVLE